MGGIEERELRRRAIEGVRDEVEAFGSGAPDSRLLRRDGLLASLTRASPERSLFNSVYYEDGASALPEALDELKQTYEDAGIRAWTVWVPDSDRETAELMASRGHVLDAAPRAMAMEMSELVVSGGGPDGVERRPATSSIGAELNDLAYGYGADGFRAAIAAGTSISWHGAYDGEEAVGCVGTIDVGDDCVVTGVATPPEHRGRGIASWLLTSVLAEKAASGMATASLQATKAGAPLYERMGFADFGYIEMWELRR